MKTGKYRNRLRPWTARLIDSLLANPDGMDQKVVVDEASLLVPPGRSFRRATRRGKTGSFSKEQSIRTGSRQIVRDSLLVMIRHGSIERYELDGQVYLRLTDEGKRRLIVEKE